MNDIVFKAQVHPIRIFSGPSILEHLPKEIDRLGARRVLLISGRTVSRTTSLIDDIEALLDNRLSGRFDEIDRHCLEPSMTKAIDFAKQRNVDSIVAIGAGTACMAARIIAIGMAEKGKFEQLATNYLPGQVPVSPRLLQPKGPIWNVLTTATAAQNGAGATMNTSPQSGRLEFFDPKTRATGVFWDGQALSTASIKVTRAAALSTLWFALMRMGGVSKANPLVQADRHHAWQLALNSIDQLSGSLSTEARINMCAASYLLNRDFDHGGLPFEAHWVCRVCYALGAGLMSVCKKISPGEAYLSLTLSAMLIFGDRDLEVLREMCSYLPSVNRLALKDWGVKEMGRAIEEFFALKQFSFDPRSFGVTPEDFPRVRNVALRNFNADRRSEFGKEVELLDKVLSLALVV